MNEVLVIVSLIVFLCATWRIQYLRLKLEDQQDRSDHWRTQADYYMYEFHEENCKHIDTIARHQNTMMTLRKTLDSTIKENLRLAEEVNKKCGECNYRLSYGKELVPFTDKMLHDAINDIEEGKC